ncbi:MAG: histidine phosphatase family protein [Proteobacteria bacterium]|nr:histidine phosphatase family protein [Pseudomonadota bacterium]
MYLIRHGQSEFNAVFSLTRVDPGIRDPRLTEEGRRQAAAAAQFLKQHDIRRLLASPYTRTLETATIIADALGLEVTIEPMVRERAAYMCDVGASPAVLAQRFPRFRFDHLDDPWWHDHIELGQPEAEDALLVRCADFRKTMAAVADWRHVAVVTHWGFIRGMTGRPVPNGEIVHLPLDE